MLTAINIQRNAGRRLLTTACASNHFMATKYLSPSAFSQKKTFTCKSNQFVFNIVRRQHYATLESQQIDPQILQKFTDKKAFHELPQQVQQFICEKVAILQPDQVYICNGSDAENAVLIHECEKLGFLKKLNKMENCYIARTDPADVARVESKTVISTESERETVSIPLNGKKSTMGNWISPEDLNRQMNERFPGCMKGRTMYVIPFSMGPASSPLSKIGIELTDSPYVVASMRVMTRMGTEALNALKKGDRDFVKCTHSVGQPLPAAKPFINNWPCNPKKVIIAHVPKDNEILSFGSGYGGNSLLGKKCLALRLGSILARREGWLAAHMLILGITNPEGKKKYIAAAFPSACGKTNLAMLQPTIPGYKIECVGDDIAWMKFDKDGKLRAINPEYGFFGVAPGTCMQTNPNAMLTIQKNTIFTNVAETDDSGVFWEGLENEVDLSKVKVTDWLNRAWKPGETKTPAAHPNSRFCAPASQCPIIDTAWEDPKGVHIEAILFGGRRPQGVPLVYEATSWSHGVFIGAAMRSEATAAAEHKGKSIMHDPFAMRPFFGYNFGHYLKHWLSFNEKSVQLPRIFHVNWFRKSEAGKFLWPGFGDNIRVLDWIFQRVDGDDSIAQASPIGYIPTETGINLQGLESYKHLNMKELLSVPKEFWQKEVTEIRQFLTNEVGEDLPAEIIHELDKVTDKVTKM